MEADKRDMKTSKPSNTASIIAGVIVLVLFGYIVSAMSKDDVTEYSGESDTTSQSVESEEVQEEVGTLPLVSAEEHTGKEGLVVFKELATKGYDVRASYINERLPDMKQDMTEQFKNADADKCEDRLGFDAYVVGDIVQMGDTVSLILDNKPNSNQTCPDGTPYQP